MPKDTSKPHNQSEMAATGVLGAARAKAKHTLSQPPKSKLVTTESSQGSSSKKLLSLSPHSQLQHNDILKASLETLEQDTMGDSWHTVLKPEFKKPYFQKLKTFLLAEHTAHTIYPPLKDLYSWSKLTPLDDVRVVVLGQDPYHNVGQAHGLSFSVLPPTKPPGSLKNIYKQIALDYPSFVAPKSGDLTPLAQAGVLWLNTSLTVRARKAASHANKGWETFTAQAIRAVMDRQGDSHRGVVFMAWGLPAQKTCAKIGIDEGKHLVLKSAHPSPLSAHRGFIGNGHFKQANVWLKERYGEDGTINWEGLSAPR